MPEKRITSPIYLGVYILAIWGVISGYFSIISYTESNNWGSWQYVAGVFIILLLSLAYWSYKLRDQLTLTKAEQEDLLIKFKDISQKHQAIVTQFKEKQSEVSLLQLQNDQYSKDFSKLFVMLNFVLAELITGQTIEQRITASENILNKFIRRGSNE